MRLKTPMNFSSFLTAYPRLCEWRQVWGWDWHFPFHCSVLLNGIKTVSPLRQYAGSCIPSFQSSTLSPSCRTSLFIYCRAKSAFAVPSPHISPCQNLPCHHLYFTKFGPCSNISFSRRSPLPPTTSSRIFSSELSESRLPSTLPTLYCW